VILLPMAMAKVSPTSTRPYNTRSGHFLRRFGRSARISRTSISREVNIKTTEPSASRGNLFKGPGHVVGISPTLNKCQERFHVHVGAGKLGLGLVLDSIQQGSQDFAVIQRPSSAWRKLADNNVEEVTVHVNGESSGKAMKFLHGKCWPSMVRAGQGPYFILSEAGTPLISLAQKATSFSCSLKNGISELKIVLAALPKRRDPPRLYACENDKEAIEDLATSPELKDRVVVVPCMVDRISSSRDIGGDGVIDVGTEPWHGQIVVLPSPVKQESETPIPFGGPSVLTSETDAQANYYAERKLLLVNGAHTTLAFLTLIQELEKSKTSLKDMPLPGDFKLLDYDRADESTKRILWAWSLARCHQLANRLPPEVLMGAHGVGTFEEALAELINYAWSSMQRFSHVSDSTGRVLSGGLVDRFHGRLKNVLDEIELESNGVTLEQVAALASCQEGRPTLTPGEIYNSIDTLVADSMPLAEETARREMPISARIRGRNEGEQLPRRRWRIISDKIESLLSLATNTWKAAATRTFLRHASPKPRVPIESRTLVNERKPREFNYLM